MTKYERLKPYFKKDCFAFLEGKDGKKSMCGALNVLDCENCAFFKTREEFSTSLNAAERKKQCTYVTFAVKS